MKVSAALAVIWLLACVHTAPKNADEQAHVLWQAFTADDASILRALDDWHVVAKGEALTEDKSGKLSALSLAEIRGLAMSADVDLGEARGVYFFNVIDGCTLDQIEAIEASPNQAELFPQTYDAFERIFESDERAYFARQSSLLHWRNQFTDTILDARFDAELHSSLRRVTSNGKSAIVTRTHQPFPAVIVNGADADVTQDFHLDAYYPRSDGKIMHVHVLWGRLRVGIISTNDDIVLSVMLSNMKGWDDIKQTHCKSGAF